MKTICILVISIFSFFASETQTFEELMLSSIEEMYQARSAEDIQLVMNQFERIMSVNPDKWEVYYYMGYSKVMKATFMDDLAEKDMLFDQAMLMVKKAIPTTKDPLAQSELIALKGFAMMLSLNVDPANRGPQLSGQVIGLFRKSMALSEVNPRPVYFLAQMQYGMAQFMGSGVEEACSMNQKAIQMFDNFTTENPIHPSWGKSGAERFKANCK